MPDHREYLKLLGKKTTLMRVCETDDIDSYTDEDVEARYQEIKDVDAALEEADD